MYTERKFWQLCSLASAWRAAAAIIVTYASTCSGPGMAGVPFQEIDTHRICSALRVLWKLLSR